MELNKDLEDGGIISISEFLEKEQSIMVVLADKQEDVSGVFISRSESLQIVKHLITQFGFTEQEMKE